MSGKNPDPPRGSRRAEANRANAKRSTGPRSPDGKIRAARNSLRHGLAIGAGSVPELALEVADLAGELAGEGASEVRRERAWEAACAQVDLLRVRAVRFAQLVAILLVLDEAVKPPPEPDPDIVAPPFEECTEEALQRVIAALEEKILEEEIRNSKERPPTPTEILTLLVSKMASLERYERRAFSRRKHALRALIELGT